MRTLEVTYRKGRPFAAYLHLARTPGEPSARVEERGAYLIDWSADGHPLGIEMPYPSLVTREGLNQLLADLHLDPEEAPAPFLTSANAMAS